MFSFKFQNPSTKLQIITKFKIAMTKTWEPEIQIGRVDSDYVNRIIGYYLSIRLQGSWLVLFESLVFGYYL